MAKKSANEGISAALKGNFDLNKFKKARNLTSSSFKPQQWIPVSEAIQDTLSIRGIPHGHITLLRGHSDTGKTTLLLDIAKNCQSQGILPVFIVTEMKFNWEHLMDMGIQATRTVNEDGNVVYEGEFIYVDRSSLNTIEDVAAFITGLLDDQSRGDLPYDLCFLWDSIGSIPCELSVKSNKNNNEWNAGAMATAFGNWVNQRIVLSRKVNQIYTNSLVAVNKIWTQKPDSPVGRPRMVNRGGNAMWYDASLIITFGNVMTAGTSKLKATKNGKAVEFGKITNVQVEKFHIGDVASRGNVVMTKHGFIKNEPKSIDAYKKLHSKEWLNALGADDEAELQYEQEDETEDSVTTINNILSDL